MQTQDVFFLYHCTTCVIISEARTLVSFQVVACLKDAQRYARLNAKMPSGVLLCGAPGTGKTLLGKSCAGLGALEYHVHAYQGRRAVVLFAYLQTLAILVWTMLGDRMGTCSAYAGSPLHICFARIMHRWPPRLLADVRTSMRNMLVSC